MCASGCDYMLPMATAYKTLAWHGTRHMFSQRHANMSPIYSTFLFMYILAAMAVYVCSDFWFISPYFNFHPPSSGQLQFYIHDHIEKTENINNMPVATTELQIYVLLFAIHLYSGSQDLLFWILSYPFLQLLFMSLRSSGSPLFDPNNRPSS